MIVELVHIKKLNIILYIYCRDGTWTNDLETNKRTNAKMNPAFSA